jgi:hypothetical protein
MPVILGSGPHDKFLYVGAKFYCKILSTLLSAGLAISLCHRGKEAQPEAAHPL